MVTPDQEITIRVFLSSPGDVGEERLVAYREVESFAIRNYNFLSKYKVRLEPVGWDRAGGYVPMEANIDPQGAINDRLPQSSECDIAIFIFWSRMGTELDKFKYLKPEPYQYDVSQDEIKSQYFSGTEFEFVSALIESVKDSDNHPHSFVFVKKPEAYVLLGDKDKQEKYRQYERLERFLESFKKGSGDSLKGHYEIYKDSQDFGEKLQKTLQNLVTELVNKPPAKMLCRKNTSIISERIPWKGSPFPGLRTFNEKDERIYFGRSNEISQLIDRVKENRFVAVIGASGAGKSSLVRAGLIPAIRNNEIRVRLDGTRDWDEPQDWIVESAQWVVITMKPGQVEDVDDVNKDEDELKNPFDALYLALTKVFSPTIDVRNIEALRRRIEEPASDLVKMDNSDSINEKESLERLEIKRQEYREDLSTIADELLNGLSANAEILLLVDQFEELFTLVKDTILRKAFILFMDQFVLCKRCRIILTMRADFYQDYIQYPVLAQMFNRSTFNLAPPGLGALNEMIRRPAEVARLTFEENVAEKILVDTNTDKNAGALPLMAYLLDLMYERCKTGQLTMATYNELGGVGKAITKSAESVIDSLKTKIPSVDKLLYNVFKELVELKEIGLLTRRRASKAKITVDPDADQLVTRLIEARLLCSDILKDPLTGKNEEVIEVAHEALLQEWERLANWVKDNKDYFLERHKIERDATEWYNLGEDSSLLWSQKELLPFYKAIDRLGYKPDIFTPVIQKFIEPEVLRIIKELSSSKTPHKRRLAIGDRLLELGDPRYGLSVDSEGIPRIAWCETPVPAGDVILEKVDETFHVNQFYISKYPVTFAQYHAFIKADDGYNNEAWWDGLGVTPQNLKIHAQTPPNGNHPAVWVSWHQAIVFCRWLSSKLGFEVRIPYEWEWQQAATGGNPANLYPWGPTWDNDCCNSYKSELNSIVAVGLYPNGRSPVGAEDMAGNVVEWCINTFKQPEKIVNFQDNSRRTTRGGAFFLTGSQRAEGKSVENVVSTSSRLDDDPFDPTQGKIRVSIRLVADHVLEALLQNSELSQLAGIPESISNYYVNEYIM